MRVIPSNEVRMTPMHCAVVPTIGQMSGHRFIDTRQDMHCASVNTPNRIYVSEPAVREMAKLMGWTPPEDVRVLTAERDRLAAELELSRAATADLEQRFGAIDVLASAGFVARKKPGRPPSEKAVV